MRPYLQQPLIPIAIAACIGSCLGCEFSFFKPGDVLVAIFGLLLGIYFIRHTPWALLGLLVAVVLLFWMRADMTLRWQDSLSDVGTRRSVIIQGVIHGFPVYNETYDYWKGIVDCQQLTYRGKAYPLAGKATFLVSSKIQQLQPKQAVIITGSLEPIDPPRNPGEFDYLAFMKRQGISMKLKGQLRANTATGTSLGATFWKTISRIRYTLETNIRRSVPQNAQAFILAVTTGNRQEMDQWQREKLVIAGLAHIIAISGVHAGILYVVIVYLAALCGLQKRTQLLIGLLAIALLVLITGFKIPILRAFVMLAGITTASLFNKKGSTNSGIALAILVLVFIHPCTVYDAGFQLSVIATVFIVNAIFLSQKNMSGKGLFLKLFTSTLIVSSVSLVGTLPIVLFHFHQIAPWSMVANILSVPLVGITVVLGFLSGLFGFLPIIGKMMGFCASIGVLGIDAIADWIQYFPWSRIFCWRAPIPWIFGYYLLCFIYFLLRKTDIFERKIKKRLEIGMVSMLIIWIISIRILQPKENYLMKVTFLSLNVGESTLIETHTGEKILIDTGTESDFFWRIKPFLAHKGINHLDAIILSHADLDHAGGLRTCLAFFNVGKLIYGGGNFAKQGRQKELHEWLDKNRTQIIPSGRGRESHVGQNMLITGIWPPRGVTAQSNEKSFVCLLEYRGIKMLFPGDVSAKVQRQWGVQESMDLFKVAHHGDLAAFEKGLLMRIHPKVSVVMPGNRNAFGLPDEKTLVQLKDHSEWVFNTKTQGAVELYFLEKGFMRWQTRYGQPDQFQPIAGGEKI